MKVLIAGISLFVFTFSNVCLAKKSEFFFLSMTARVCDSLGKCKRYDGDAGNYQIELENKNGEMVGTSIFSYVTNGVTVTNSITVYERVFQSEPRVELYAEIKNSTSDFSTIGTSIVSPKLSQLNWINPSGVPFEINGTRIYPELVIGPAME
jgi:hypothetical protein